MKFFKFLYTYILVIYSVSLFSQERLKFDHISIEQGLSQSSIFDIIQDDKGFLWFATLDGLNRYDGYKMKIYRANPLDTNSIAGNSISSICEDSYKAGGNVIWIGTQTQGLCMYNKIENKFINIRHDPNDPSSLCGDNIRSIYVDYNGTLWVGTTNGLSRLYLEDRKELKFFNYKSNLKDRNSIVSNDIKKIVGDRTGNLWIGTSEGLSKLNVSRKIISNFKHQILNKKSIISNKINTLFIDGRNTLWVGTDKGLEKFDRSKKYFHHYNYKKNVNSISGNYVTSIVEDSKSNLWIGTKKNGLNKLNKKKNHFYNYRADKNVIGLGINNILSLYFDRSGVLWVGTYLAGVSRTNELLGVFEVYRNHPYEKNSLSSSLIRSIFEDNEGIFWIGTVDKGLNRWDIKKNEFKHFFYDKNDSTSLSNNHVRTIIEDKNNNLWMGTEGGGINKFDRKTQTFKHYKHNPKDRKSLSNNNIWKLFEDRNGNIWVATLGGGLNLIDTINGTFSSYRHDPENERSLSDDNVTTIYQDHLGVLWVGTLGGGLNQFNWSDKSFTRYDEQSIAYNRVYLITEDSDNNLWIGTKGSLNKFDREKKTFKVFDEPTYLPNDVVMGILDDEEGNLWISTNNGICRFSKKTKDAKTFDVTNGLQSNEFLVGSFCKAKDGKFYFGGINGMNAFYPKNIKNNVNIPRIVISGFKVFNEEKKLDTFIIYKKHIKLSYEEKAFSFDFVALSYIFSQKNEYAYKMEGYDKDWVYSGKKRYANYMNLPHGDYVFRVKGANSDGVWNRKGTTIRITIKPPFVKTFTFYVLITIIVSSMLYGFIKFREKKLKKNEHKLEFTIKERTKEILTQKEKLENQRGKERIQAREIRSSIEYARFIQNAVLPPEDIINEILPEHFILYKPKDIVSGDFYWIKEKNNKIIIIAADCTGHGVPGAFMSMLGVAFLNEIVTNSEVKNASNILDSLRDMVKTALHQTGKVGESQDGMDLALCILDKNANKLQYAGAYNPLYLIRKQNIRTLEEYMKYKLYQTRADKMPIGIYPNEKPNFTNHEIDIKKGDTIYIFSDGYIDQFGGEESRKFLTKHFKSLLLYVQPKTMKEQKKILHETIENWRGEGEQIDDMLVIGFRI